MSKTLFVGLLLNAGFTPYLWESNESEYALRIEDCEIYVQFNARGVTVSVTNKVIGKRLLTAYPSGTLEVLEVLGQALSIARKG